MQILFQFMQKHLFKIQIFFNNNKNQSFHLLKQDQKILQLILNQIKMLFIFVQNLKKLLNNFILIHQNFILFFKLHLKRHMKNLSYIFQIILHILYFIQPVSLILNTCIQKIIDDMAFINTQLLMNLTILWIIQYMNGTFIVNQNLMKIQMKVYWNNLAIRLPFLSQIALDYIWLPVSSYAVECSFSLKLVTGRRFC